MAANMSQIGGGGPGRRPQHQQLSQVVYSNIITHAVPNTGWQGAVSPNMRVGNAMNIITNAFLAMPQAEHTQIMNVGLAYERDAFTTSPDKATYEGRILGRVNELFKKRQANEQNLHNNFTAQAQNQAQAQMLMNQNMQMRTMGQPLQPGFQNFQQQMQPSPINQQSQPNIGVSNPNGLPMTPNQQAMQMGAHMRPPVAMQASMANLTPQDRAKVTQLALEKLNGMSETQRNQVRAILQQKFGPQGLAQFQQDNVDPILFFLQQQMLSTLSRNQAGANQARMQMQAHQQRSMAQAAQQLPMGSNGEYAPFANLESVMNQQKAGMMAQEAGQMVVPASNGAGPNTVPQPMGSLPGPNQGAGQPGLPHQPPQQFSHQPAQQLKMDQLAAQSQAQIRAQAQAKQIQGQPGGLNGPGGASQSPAMNTLNAPVRRTPMGVSQAEGHPQMGHGGMPFAQQMMDPRFNQAGQRTPMGPNSNMSKNQILQNIFLQMPIEHRQHAMSLPPDKMTEMIMRWQASRTGPMASRPQPQIGQVGHGNTMTQSMGQFPMGNNSLSQHPNFGMPANQQGQLMMQQINKLRNPNTPQGPPDRSVLMDNMGIPSRVIEQMRSSPLGNPPPDVKKWGQLKQWLAQKNPSAQATQSLLSIQNAQFSSYLKSNPGFAIPGSQPPQPGMPQGIHPNGQAAPQMVVPGPNSGITVSLQEVQNARSHDRFKDWPDERIRQLLLQMKLQALRSRGSSQSSGPPTQAPQGAPQGQAATTSGSSQVANGAAAPQKQQNHGPEANGASPAVPGRNIKQPTNGRAIPNATVTPTAKTGTKRPMPDDAAEGSQPPGPSVQRPHPQQSQPGASSIPPQAHQLSPEQLASLTPEQRQRYDALVKNKQSASANMMNEDVARLKTIGQEQHTQSVSEKLPDIEMSPEQFRDTAQKIQAMAAEMNKIRRLIIPWYSMTHDDTRARLFFKLRSRLVKQYVDLEKMTKLRDKFSITAADLDSIKNIVDSMTKDMVAKPPQNMRKNPSQQKQSEATPAQGASTHPGALSNQTAPLNAANLEKQTQALSRTHQRNNSRAGQPPAAPTTAQPPFSFGAQSPDGQPTYAGKPAVTQDNLQLPARKKLKPDPRTGTGPSQNESSANASPQVQKMSSPEINKRQAAPTAAQQSAKPQYLCTDPYCDFRSIGFPSEDALNKHKNEEHVKPAQDPMKYVAEGLAEVLGLDANGKVKKALITDGNIQSPGELSKQIQTSVGRAEPANSREAPMKRQGSSTGPKPNELIKTIPGKVGTPKVTGTKPTDGVAATITAHGGTAPQVPVIESIGTTVDPQELMTAVTGLETGGNGAILDMATYRTLTPNDTPESSKDSALSEPNSDVSDGVALNFTLDMGFGTWDPFAPGHERPLHPDPENYGDYAGLPYPGFAWDEFEPDFDKPFALDTSFFSLDTS